MLSLAPQGVPDLKRGLRDRVELEVLPQMVSRAVWDQGGMVPGKCEAGDLERRLQPHQAPGRWRG